MCPLTRMQTTEAENFDRSTIGLAGVQEALIQAVFAANPNTVVGACTVLVRVSFCPLPTPLSPRSIHVHATTPPPPPPRPVQLWQC